MKSALSVLAVILASYAFGYAMATPCLDPNGQVMLSLCGKEGVNESMGVGRDFTKESLGVQCENGESFRVIVR